MTGCGDGRFMEKRYFFCQDEHGFFCSVSDIQPLEPTAGGAPVSTRAAPGPINCEYIIIKAHHCTKHIFEGFKASSIVPFINVSTDKIIIQMRFSV